MRLSDEPKPGERSLARREKHEQRRGIGVWTLDADRESCKEHHPRACAESSRSLAIPLALGSRRSGRPRIRQTRPSWGRYPPAFGRVASFPLSGGSPHLRPHQDREILERTVHSIADRARDAYRVVCGSPSGRSAGRVGTGCRGEAAAYGTPPDEGRAGAGARQRPPLLRAVQAPSALGAGCRS